MWYLVLALARNLSISFQSSTLDTGNCDQLGFQSVVVALEVSAGMKEETKLLPSASAKLSCSFCQFVHAMRKLSIVSIPVSPSIVEID